MSTGRGRGGSFSPQEDAFVEASNIKRRRTRSAGRQRVDDNAFHLVQRLSWRGFAVRKNVSSRRRKLLNAGTRDDDTVTAAVSFLSDAQEPAAIILPELDVEVLALNL